MRPIACLAPIAVLALAGCGPKPAPNAPPAAGRAPEKLRTIAGFKTPESCVSDPATGAIYVSNVEITDGNPWAEDGKGFISRLKPDGAMDQLRWRDSTREYPIHGPKGLCILNGVLYAADLTRVLRFPLDGSAPKPPLKPEGAKLLNDMATDGRAAYVSDMGGAKVYRIDAAGAVTAFKAPEGVNGIAFAAGRMFCVSLDLHELYELDPAGKQDPKPFGLADRFVGLDGLEVLDDGTFLVSDHAANKVFTIAPDRRTVKLLLETETPADFGLSPKQDLLFVPLFRKDSVEVYRLPR